MNEVNATKERRRRVWLLGAIGLVLVATFVMRSKLADRDATRAQQAPAERARAALLEAKQAAIDEDLPAMDQTLRAAAEALDAALETNPADIQLARARVSVSRRLARVCERRGRAREAAGLLRDAHQRAGKLHEAAPTDALARQSRLGVARELAAALKEAGDAEGAMAAAEAALTGVEATLPGTPPGALVRGELSRLWLQVAAARTDPAQAMEAANRAIAHAEAEQDTPEGLAHLYATLARGIEVADRMQRGADAARLEHRAIAVLRLRRSAGAEGVNTTLARHLRRLAGRAAGTEALALHREAVSLARETLGATPTPETRRSLALGLNQLGAALAETKEHDAALEAYAEAARVATALTGAARRTRLVALGNRAHLLGRLDRMVSAKQVAATAYRLAVDLASDGSPRAALDAAAAGLRHARLLRAKPRPRQAEARRVARVERARLGSYEGTRKKRAKSLQRGLDELLRELGMR